MRKRGPALAMAAFATAVLLCPACASQTSQAEGAPEDESGVSRQVADAGITARLKTTYLFNEHLNSFRINVDTDDGVVTLNGTVRSDIQKELAGEIAENTPGVTGLSNRLQVTDGEVQSPGETERTFTQAVSDATVTASVKTALALEEGVKAREINVDTQWGTVTLNGRVGSAAERDLAGEIARDVMGVEKVVNELDVAS